MLLLMTNKKSHNYELSIDIKIDDLGLNCYKVKLYRNFA